MADYDLSAIEPENLDAAETYEVDFATGHVVGDIVRANGARGPTTSQAVGGIVIRAGNANGNKTLVLRRGVIRGIAGAAAAANALIYNDGDNSASDAEPAGAAGTGVSLLGVCISATRALIDPEFYEKGA